jgi:hypothetical protein
MRKLASGVVVLASLGVVPLAAAEIFRTHVTGTAASATFHDVSADGCVETSGQLVALSSSNGTYALVLAERWDSCAENGPAGSFYGGGAEIGYAGRGLASASASGTVVADEYTGRGLPPLRVEFSLTFAGTGAVSAQASRFTSGGGGATVSFVATRSRAANITGSLSVDGDAADTATGTLYAETAGELVVVH